MPDAPDLAEPQPDELEVARRIAWVSQVRGLHRNKRVGALMGCALAIAMMLWSRFAGGPAWALPAGLAVVGASWAVFLFVMVDRYRWVKANPYRPGG